MAFAVALAAASLASTSAFALKATVGMNADGTLVNENNVNATSVVDTATNTATVTIKADGVAGAAHGVFANMYDDELPNTDAYPDTINVVVSGSTFNQTTSTNAGGALTLWNSSQWNGGSGLNHQIVNTTFSGSSATNNGGAVSLMGYGNLRNAGTTTISNSTFTGNKTTGAQGQGGAVYGEATDVVINQNSSFEGNKAYNGGAVSLSQNTTLDVSDATFTGNHADRRGGAIYTDGTSAIAIDGSTFKENSSDNAGGAIAISNFTGDVDPVSISNTTFEDNTAVAKGGALVVFNMESSYNHANVVALDNVVFRNNKVETAATTNGTGGAVHSEADITVTGNSLFEGNSATHEGGAIYVGKVGAGNNETPTLTLAAGENETILFRNNTADGAANDVFMDAGTEANLQGDGSIELRSGLAGTGAVNSSAASVYVADVSNYNGALTISEGKFAVEAGSYLNSENLVFGENATISTTGEGQLVLSGIETTGTIKVANNLTEGTNIGFDSAFLTGEVTADGLTVETNTDILADAGFSDEVLNNLNALYQNGPTTAQSDILNRFSREGRFFSNGSLTKQGKDAFIQATGGSATAGAFNVAYDAQTQVVDSITRHQIGEHSGYGVWADVFYTANEAKTLYGNSGYDTDIYGGIVGFDATFSCGATAGIALSVGTADTDTKGALKNNLDTDFWGVSLYASKDFAGFDLKMDIGYMAFDNDFSGLGDASDVDAYTVGLRGDFKAYDGETVKVVPHMGIRYTYLDGDDTAFNDDQSMNLVEMPIGVAVNGNFDVSGWKLVPQIDFTIVPQIGDDDIDTFAGSVDVIDNLYNTTLGVSAAYGNFKLGLDYKFGFGSDDRTNNSVNLKARYVF